MMVWSMKLRNSLRSISMSSSKCCLICLLLTSSRSTCSMISRRRPATMRWTARLSRRVRQWASGKDIEMSSVLFLCRRTGVFVLSCCILWSAQRPNCHYRTHRILPLPPKGPLHTVTIRQALTTIQPHCPNTTKTSPMHCHYQTGFNYHTTTLPQYY